MEQAPRTRVEAQWKADRIRVFREELEDAERAGAFTLTEDQRNQAAEYCRGTLAKLAEQFDVDTTEREKQFSWGMRIASTLGGLALCAALVLFFMRYWGHLDTWMQLTLVTALPLAALWGVEYAARKERALYFAGLLSLIALAAFVLNLAVAGAVFNMIATKDALLAWGVFALLIAYRHGLRLMLAAGLALVVCWVLATFTVGVGQVWYTFGDRAEPFAVAGLAAFGVPFVVMHKRFTDFPPVYRVLGLLTFWIAVLILSFEGQQSYLPLDKKNVERIYELIGLVSSAAAVWLGVRREWAGVVNLGSAAFALFLFIRLFHWWWDWMPKYLFFACVGLVAIGLMVAFRKLRARTQEVRS